MRSRGGPGAGAVGGGRKRRYKSPTARAAPAHSGPGGAMEEAQRLLTVSVWKLYRCRLQRGGLRLHQSLQLSLLVRAARHRYLTARAAELGPTAGNPLGMAPGDPHGGDPPRRPSPDLRCPRDREDPASPDPHSPRDREDPASPDSRGPRDREDPASPDPHSPRDREDPASPDPRGPRDREDPASPDPRGPRYREDPASPNPRGPRYREDPASPDPRGPRYREDPESPDPRGSQEQYRDHPQASPSRYCAQPSSPRPPAPPRDPPSAPCSSPPPEPGSPGAAPVARVGRKRRSSGSGGAGPVLSKRARLEAEEPPLAPGPPGRCSGMPAAAFAFLVRAVGAC
ncbi:immediate early response gene 2 protein [Neopsephotus bourkii]|uniref:immediate early response gene 2 protein n=1 Tax=Neopsephotus bourkii TaxID=309878 RepID=UPI002AA5A24D|nr:immediate early response gene 2 protein [Neopsephotus bourkii]